MKNYDGNIEYGEKIVYGEKVITLKKEFIDCCLLEVEVGTNGFHGGDSGSVTYIKFKDLGSTYMHVNKKDNCLATEEFEITLGGDAELQTIARAFKWAAKVLEVQSDLLNRGYDNLEGDVL